MTSEPRAFAAVDIGAATVSVSIVGKLGRAWRLIGSIALPSVDGPETAISILLDRVTRADPTIVERLGLEGLSAADLVRLEVRSDPARTLGIVAATERTLGPLVAAAARSGWRTVSASAQTTDPLAMTQLLLDAGTDAILVGASDPPAADERSAIGELAALVAAVATRRPDRLIILAGGMADRQAEFGDPAGHGIETVLAPAAGAAAANAAGVAGTTAGAPLQDLLLELSGRSDDARRGFADAAATLADLTDRRVELIEIGYDGAVRAAARPATASQPAWLRLDVVPSAGLAPSEPDDATVDRVLTWSTVAMDRHRVRDRMRELRIAPWSDATGDGLDIRVAAAHAALGRLVEATGAAAEPAPDLVVASGGVWAAMPTPLVAMTLADLLRRPGASQVAFDHASLLAPLGSIPDDAERRAVMTDLLDDLLVPLGTLVMPSGLRSGRPAGRLIVHDGDRADVTELSHGELTRVALAPGAAAVAEFRFRDTVRLGGRGRVFAIDVAGGSTGVLVDLRDVPLRLPDRADSRREQLRAWQQSVGPAVPA